MYNIKTVNDYTSNILEKNKTIINKTLDDLYKNHPEIYLNKTMLNYDTNMYSLISEFYTYIHNKNDQKYKVSVKWPIFTNHGFIDSIDKPCFSPQVICLEGNWYLLNDKETVYDIAKQYGHIKIMNEILERQISYNTEQYRKQQNIINFKDSEITKLNRELYWYNTYFRYIKIGLCISIILNISHYVK